MLILQRYYSHHFSRYDYLLFHLVIHNEPGRPGETEVAEMNAEMDYYEIPDKGGTHFQKSSLLFGLVEKLAERREIAGKEYCNLAMDQYPFVPPDIDGIKDAIIQFVADDIIGIVSMAANKNGLSANMNSCTIRLKEVLEHYANEH